MVASFSMEQFIDSAKKFITIALNQDGVQININDLQLCDICDMYYSSSCLLRCDKYGSTYARVVCDKLNEQLTGTIFTETDEYSIFLNELNHLEVKE